MADQRVALVTGGSRGIGRAIALKLAEQGFQVAVNFVSRADAAEEVVSAIVAAGSQAIAVKGNVASEVDRAAMLEQTLAEFGRIDLLVNNAGIGSPNREDLLKVSQDDWDVVFDTNLKGPFFLSQRVANAMIELVAAGTIAQGKIINISSISSFAASTNRAEYCMAKAAMGMMTNVMALRLAEEKIQVFEVSPGMTQTDMTARVSDKYTELIEEGGLVPIRRWGQPEDIALAVEAIVSDRFPFSTGQRFDVDGGFHIRSF